MTVEQLSIFIENKRGRAFPLVELMAENGINLISCNVSETSDYGIIRFIVDNPQKAKEILKANKFVVKSTNIIVVEISNAVGGLAEALKVFNDLDLSIKYLYAFVGNKIGKAVVGIKIDNLDENIEKLKNTNLKFLGLDDLK